MHTKILLISGGIRSITSLYHYVKQNKDDKFFGMTFNSDNSKNKRFEYSNWHIWHLNLYCQSYRLAPYQDFELNENKFRFIEALKVSHAIAEAEVQDIKEIIVLYDKYEPEDKDDLFTIESLIYSMNTPARIGTVNKVQIKIEGLPYKLKDLINYGQKMNIDYSKTWDCKFQFDEKHCGECANCLERKKAFKDSQRGIDTTEYEK